MANYRLFPTTNGPAGVINYGGNFIAGLAFEVTADNCWFDGYWWWVAPTGGLTAPQKFALWLITGAGTGIVIPAATVTSSALSTGWNYIPMPTPLQLPIGGSVGTGGATFVAATGINGSFPDTDNSFGTGQPYGAGITNGPLTAFSAQGAGNPGPFGIPQGCFSTGGSDPTVTIPAQQSGTDNFWMDVQVSDTAPASYSGSYRFWPNFPNVTNQIPNSIDAQAQTTGTMFSLSQPCQLNNIWLYSPAGVGGLPASTQIWNTATRALVPGTNLTAAWSGAVGSGWVANAYGGLHVTLPAGEYIATVFHNAGTTFYTETRGYFGAFNGVNGPGLNGITNGPLSAPSTAQAVNPPGGNSCYFYGGTVPTYPNDWDEDDGGENRWVDVEVTAAASTIGGRSGTVNSGAFLAFFP